jgi:hypothetical protein
MGSITCILCMEIQSFKFVLAYFRIPVGQTITEDNIEILPGFQTNTDTLSAQ